MFDSQSQGSPLAASRSGIHTPPGFISSLPKVTRMPREGPAIGGGLLTVKDRSVFEGQVRVGIENEQLLALEDLRKAEKSEKAKRRQTSLDQSYNLAEFDGRPASRRSEARRPGFDGDSPRSEDGSNKRVGPRERKQQEMYFKWQKAETLRTHDSKTIMERVERAKDARETRFKRLLNSVTGEGTLAQETAKTLRERDAHEEQRRRELHEQWQLHVHTPMLEQADRHLNPPDRAMQQRRVGHKTVGWNLPEDEFKIKVSSNRDPSRRVLAEMAYDNAFHEAAERLLAGRTQSAPSVLTGGPGAMPRSQSAPLLQGGDKMVLSGIPKARSRHVLDPTVWSQRQIQGTLYGQWAQVCESGEGFRRSIRGGPSAHIPDESDGVMCAGTRISRAHGHNDKGILKGDVGLRGEVSEFKQVHGPSCGAPAQDHFTFQQGPRVTDLEFPLGKRPPPPGSYR